MIAPRPARKAQQKIFATVSQVADMYVVVQISSSQVGLRRIRVINRVQINVELTTLEASAVAT